LGRRYKVQGTRHKKGPSRKEEQEEKPRMKGEKVTVTCGKKFERFPMGGNLIINSYPESHSPQQISFFHQ